MNPLHTALPPAAESLERRGSAIFARTRQTLLRHTWPITAVLLMSSSATVPAQELGARDQINVGVAKSASPQLRRSAEAEKALKVEPT